MQLQRACTLLESMQFTQIPQALPSPSPVGPIADTQNCRSQTSYAQWQSLAALSTPPVKECTRLQQCPQVASLCSAMLNRACKDAQDIQITISRPRSAGRGWPAARSWSATRQAGRLSAATRRRQTRPAAPSLWPSPAHWCSTACIMGTQLARLERRKRVHVAAFGSCCRPLRACCAHATPSLAAARWWAPRSSRL